MSKGDMMKISVLMSVYSKETPSNLEESIQSLIDQTVIPDQIVIVKNGPLTEELENEIKEISKTTIIVGEKEKRLPNTSCIITPGWKGESQVIAMDLEGFSISSGTACSSGKLSEVSLLKEMEYGEDLANCSIRVSMGPNTKKSDIEAFIFSWKQLYSRHKKNRESI